MVTSFAERRITLRLLAYWEKLRGDRAMPTEEDINPDDIRDVWDSCFLIHTNDLSKPDYNYTYLGAANLAAYRNGLDIDDPDISRLASPHASGLSSGYATVIATQKPLLEEGEFYNLHNEKIKFRQCLLPLGDAGEVKAIFGGMRFRIFT